MSSSSTLDLVRPSESANRPAQPDLERHSRKCKICNHRERDLIETDFIEWRHPNEIVDDYNVSYFALYRHARVTGLLQLRSENVAIVLHRMLEEAESVELTSSFAVLRAVRILASLNSRGQWTAPTTTHVVVNTTQRPAESANPVATSAPPPVESSSPSSTESRSGEKEVSSHSPLVTSHCTSNRKPYEKLEPHATRTKQTSEATSNRKET